MFFQPYGGSYQIFCTTSQQNGFKAISGIRRITSPIVVEALDKAVVASARQIASSQSSSIGSGSSSSSSSSSSSCSSTAAVVVVLAVVVVVVAVGCLLWVCKGSGSSAFGPFKVRAWRVEVLGVLRGLAFCGLRGPRGFKASVFLVRISGG